MTVDEATKFFEENCYYEHKPARQEAIRGAFDPGYLYYTLGKLQILKLRRTISANKERPTLCENSTTRCSATARRRFVCCGK